MLRVLIGIPLLALLLGAVAFVAVPAWEARSEAVRQQPPQVQTGVPPTPASATAVQAAPAQVTSGPPPVTPAPTRTSISQPVITTGATPASTAVSHATVTSLQSVLGAETNLPPPTALQTAEIGRAYKTFLDVTSDARLHLDQSRLADVASGNELDSLKREIEQDRGLGRALETDIAHQQVFVLGVQNDRADVADSYRDNSKYVDPATRLTLTGQAATSSGAAPPVLSVIYHLQRTNGIWRVVSGVAR
jgi:hypothetical protein